MKRILSELRPLWNPVASCADRSYRDFAAPGITHLHDPLHAPQPVAFRLEANSADSRVARRRLLAMINDPYEIAVLRWESLFEIGLAPCTNARELIFGPSQDVRDAFEVGRRDLARWRSDTLLIEMYEQGPERMRFYEQDSEVEQDVFTRFVVGAADLTGSLLGNDRIRGCARVWAAISSFS